MPAFAKESDMTEVLVKLAAAIDRGDAGEVTRLRCVIARRRLGASGK
jgi:hypothetical protein